MQMQRDIVHWHRLQAQLALAFHFHPVDTHILLAEVIRVERIAGDDTGFIQIEAAIAIVEAKQRQNIKQVDRLAINGVFRPRRVGSALGGDGERVPAADKFINLLFYWRIGRQA